MLFGFVVFVVCFYFVIGMFVWVVVEVYFVSEELCVFEDLLFGIMFEVFGMWVILVVFVLVLVICEEIVFCGFIFFGFLI